MKKSLLRIKNYGKSFYKIRLSASLVLIENLLLVNITQTFSRLSTSKMEFIQE